MPKQDIKPNGEPCGTFLISIDDGYVEYTYKLPLRMKHMSIDKMYQRIRKAFRVREQKGQIREVTNA